uniref:Uncharacterized protein n=1 Tax=Cucumis melo TaxID=3656 RepID=A0A9I9EIQ2_CUCME
MRGEGRITQFLKFSAHSAEFPASMDGRLDKFKSSYLLDIIPHYCSLDCGKAHLFSTQCQATQV